jgi:hypothetical protein
VVQVVVVVDGCDDGSVELLHGMAESEPRLEVVWQENAGEGRARQVGLERSTGDVVLFLDDDVVAGPRLAEGHARRHAHAPGLVVLGYMPTRRPAPRRPGQFATVLYADEYEGACRAYEEDPSLVLRKLWAGNLSLRRADALRVGMSVEGFSGLAHADAAFGLRCAEAGLVGVFDRSLVSTHEHERSLAAFLRDARAQGAGRIRLDTTDPGSVPLGRTATLGTAVPAPVAGALLRRSGLHGPLLAVGRLCLAVAGRCRAWGLETLVAKAMRRVEHLRGVDDERRRLRRRPVPGAGPKT